MHPVICPKCRKVVEVDFMPSFGMVNCPTCEAPFTPQVAIVPDISPKGKGPNSVDASDDNGERK
jgi:hypothetical protein